MGNVAAIILAAGGSSRFGSPKQLQTFRGKTLILRIVRCSQKAGCEPILVVVGRDRAAIAKELRDLPVEICSNEKWEAGMGSSIRRGIENLGSEGAAVLLTCDQPLVEADTIRALIATHENSGKPIVASRYAGTLGIPALFDASCWPELRALPDDAGAKSIIESNPSRVAEIDFPAGAIDIDAPEDLTRASS